MNGCLERTNGSQSLERLLYEHGGCVPSIKCFEKVGGSWKEINYSEFDNKVDELKNKPNGNTSDTTTYQGSTSTGRQDVTITVKRTINPLGSDFLMYEHTLETEGEFILKEVKDDDGNSTNGIPLNNGANVSSVSAYYWRHEKDGGGLPTKALIVGVTTTDRGTNYHVNINDTGVNKWIELKGGTQPPLINNDLERTLDDLVCSNYNEVIVDLSKGTSMGNREPYCCRCHGIKDGIDQRKITVTHVQVSCVHQKSVTICKHTVNPGYRVAAISNRRRIKSSNLDFPISNIKSVSAFYCNHNPVLIYIECGESAEGWYKKPTGSSSTDEQWKKVLPDLNSITPENIIDCGKYNQLVNALKEFKSDYQTCSEKSKSSSPPKPDSGSENKGGVARSDSAAGPSGPGPNGMNGRDGKQTVNSADSVGTVAQLTASPSSGSHTDPDGNADGATKVAQQDGTPQSDDSGSGGRSDSGLSSSEEKFKLTPGSLVVDTSPDGRPRAAVLSTFAEPLPQVQETVSGVLTGESGIPGSPDALATAAPGAATQLPATVTTTDDTTNATSQVSPTTAAQTLATVTEVTPTSEPVAPPTTSNSTSTSSTWIKAVSGTGASALGTGGAGWTAWKVFQSLFLDVFPRLI
ncbi:hypothetical protein BEWA_048780 [Theileria equi strain WA]|uniref:Uncharacterized protein n=1 Tax=Theileria equi strain WA TaxID=1537102 RepID=L1LAR2_THEEQ|nr:hypothetical protein BEWA_048780 [Theileria equi strain WA]EKX72411.1 hypothetical protein BEWA_048780 [Theileria equi strain WA]|eukprot:XP_004831863.1 hypothetical protein BEWA_048780 [Theileria equi strain WA]